MTMAVLHHQHHVIIVALVPSTRVRTLPSIIELSELLGSSPIEGHVFKKAGYGWCIPTHGWLATDVKFFSIHKGSDEEAIIRMAYQVADIEE